MLEGYLQARQEMSVSLSAPGLPAHRAPVVTAKQVGLSEARPAIVRQQHALFACSPGYGRRGGACLVLVG